MFFPLLLTSFLVSTVVTRNPGEEFTECVKSGEDLNSCGRRILLHMRKFATTGIPELGLQPLDPFIIEDDLKFKVFDLTAVFYGTTVSGFKDVEVKSSIINKEKETWDIKFSLPKASFDATYELFGSIPPGIDLGTSKGPSKLDVKSTDLNVSLKFSKQGKKLNLDDVKLDIDVEKFDLKLKCLFPKKGSCCPGNYLESCNPVLARTVLGFVNNDHKKTLKQFLPEITRVMRQMMDQNLNKLMQGVDADIF